MTNPKHTMNRLNAAKVLFMKVVSPFLRLSQFSRTFTGHIVLKYLTLGSLILPSLDVCRPTITPIRRYARPPTHSLTKSCSLFGGKSGAGNLAIGYFLAYQR